MAEIEVKSKDGQSVGKHTFGAKVAKLRAASATSVHRTVLAEEARGRQGTQSAQTRSEVSGGGRKPYKQKKTGNARQGSDRAPHYAHGAMAFAVKPREYGKKVNRKERRASILTALFAKIDAGDVVVLDAITFDEAKTKPAQELLKTLGVAAEKTVLVILPTYDVPTYKSFRNISNVTVKTAPARVAKGDAAKTDVFSARDLLVARKIVVAQDALVRIEEAWA
jgi:large subunit ribosomal protein L4